MKLLFKKLKSKYAIEIIVMIVIGAVLLNTLFISPAVGKRNNGDFGRLFLYGGLTDLNTGYNNIYDGYVHMKYALSHAGILLPFGPNWTAGTLVLKAAVAANLAGNFFVNRIFDIRFQTVIYCIIFMTGIFLILRFKKFNSILKITAGIFAVLFFTDQCYISYFNSFFGEAAVIAFFFLTIGTFLNLISKENPQKRDFDFFFISSALFLTSKSQELPLLVFMMIVYIGVYHFYKDKFKKHIISCILLAVALCACSYISIDKFTNINNNYQMIFTGVLKDSKNPKQDLKELGIDTKFSKLAGTTFYNRNLAFDPTGKVMKRDFYPKVSRGKVLLFYFKHMDRLWEKITDSAKASYRLGYLEKGNFEKGKYSKSKKVNNFRVMMIKKFPDIHRNIYVYMIFSIVFFGINLFYIIKSKDKPVKLLNLMLVFILFSGASQLVLPVIGSGEADFQKHMFFISIAYDTLTASAVIWIVYLIEKITKHFLIIKK